MNRHHPVEVPIPTSWATTSDEAAEATAIRLCLHPQSGFAQFLKEHGLSIEEIKADLQEGVSLHANGQPGHCVLFGSRFGLRIAPGHGQSSGRSIAFACGLFSPQKGDPSPSWRPSSVSFHHPRDEPLCDLQVLRQYQERIESNRADFVPPGQPVWLADQAGVLKKLNQRYAPLQSLLHLMYRRAEIDRPRPLSGAITSVSNLQDGDPAIEDRKPRIRILVELTGSLTEEDREWVRTDNKVELELEPSKEGAAPVKIRCRIHQDNDRQLWLNAAVDIGLRVDTKVRVLADPEFDKKAHQAAVKRLLAGEVVGDLHALAAVLLDPKSIPEHQEPFQEMLHIDPSLDPDQTAAVRGAFTAAHTFFIQGPPGTGKTTVITELIRQLTRRGLRVLMVAPQHVAVDNVLTKLDDKPGDGVLPIRLAADETSVDSRHRGKLTADAEEFGKKVLWPESKLADFVHPDWPTDRQSTIRSLRNQWFSTLEAGEKKAHGRPALLRKIGRELLEYANLVCSTTTGIHGNQDWRDREFDVMILDEASRANEAEFLIGAVRSRRWILVGDEKQLPPFVNQADEHHLHALLALRSVGADACDPELERAVEHLDEQWDEEQPERQFRCESVLKRATKLRSEGHWVKCRDDLDRFLRRCGDVSPGDDRAPLRFMISGLQQSLFERCVEDEDSPASLIRRMTWQRRSIPQIAELVNGPVYQGEYQTPTPCEVLPLRTPQLGAPVTFIDTAGYGDRAFDEQHGTGFINRAEQHLVLEVLRNFAQTLQRDGATASVSVLSPYKPQAGAILRYLENSKFINPGDRNSPSAPLDFEVIDAIDRIQGQESDVVIISFCRARRGRPGPNYGRWLQDVRRLNVAVTRARRSLVMIGHRPTLSQLGEEDSRVRAFFTNLFNLVDNGRGYGLVRGFGRLPGTDRRDS